MSFDRVKSRLLAAVTANPQFYRGYARRRREELRAAQSLRDLIKPEETLAIERLRRTHLWWQWLFWEGRCSRLTFLGVAAAILIASWMGIAWLRIRMPTLLAILVPGLLLWISAVVRRLHDLRRTGWWIAVWFLLSFLCGQVHDSASEAIVKVIAASIWQISTLCALAFLALSPGTRGPNLYGHSRP